MDVSARTESPWIYRLSLEMFPKFSVETRNQNLPLPLPLLLPLCWVFLRNLLLRRCPSIPKMTISGFSGWFWKPDPLRFRKTLTNLKDGFSSPEPPTYIKICLIWPAIISSSSMRIILPSQGPGGTIKSFLPLCLLKKEPWIGGNNISGRSKSKLWFPSHRPSSRSSSNKVRVRLMFL